MTQNPVAKTEMMIRKPVAEVFEAFINPEITSNFWFTRGSGRLEAGKKVQWTWAMYNFTVDADVKVVEENSRIVVEWGGYDSPTTIEWLFKPLQDGTTFVTITNSGFKGDEAVSQAISSTEGFTFVLAGLKAYLEHNIRLNLIQDRFPAGLES